MDVLLQASGVSRRQAATTVVHDVSFDLYAGQILGLLGPNGAGKSTTMRMLTGELAPSTGTVRICGLDLQEEPQRAKAYLGYLPELPPLYRELTVEEYLRYCAALRGVTRRHRGEAVLRARRRCGLLQPSRKLIGQLSKGYQQRVGIAQAIVHDPRVVVLDEPTVGLDPNQVREIRELVKELGQDRAVVISSHLLAEVQASCTHVRILHHGRLVFGADLSRLDSALGTHALIVRLGTPPQQPQLAAIAGVDAVQQLTEDRFRLGCKTPEETARAVVRAATTSSWDLLELELERRSLEQVFVELTVREEPVP